MVTERFARTGSTFGAIADPTRRLILDLLCSKERSAGELARHFPLSRPAISRHVRILRRAGLIRERREAQLRIYRLEPTRLADVDAWLAPYKLFWASRVQRLHEVAEAANSPPPSSS